MSQQASARGTYLTVAQAVKGQIDADPEMENLPLIADVMAAHDVSRGVVIRAFGVLREEGRAEAVPGGRWRVVRSGDSTDRRPLAERLTALITDRGLKVGEAFPSASALSAELGVARLTVSKALEKMEAAGLLSEGGQGKLRTVRALPHGEESS
ncbi:GntR family transcriptional regulator [Streptomyces sp. NBC_01465]|uniref:GntR family transcriptional regulator n=1 Tax=Streptomyces sp. NBC_01465 TaxID=2903878 RepID=UPI002E37AA81|nr:GntR family transcriptional regulator [Streptomyces sp. NBC_01465]